MQILDRGQFVTIRVAVKKMKPELISTDNMRQFTDEARLLFSLQHPNIVTTFGATTDSNHVTGATPCVVMELLHTSLRAVLSDPTTHTLTTPQRHGIALGIACALQYLHGRTPVLLHCDMKPENVMLTGQCVAKVADFGLCIASDSAVHGGRGTAGYVAPEAYGSPPIYTHTDVFALGMIAYELFSALPLWTGVSAALIQQHVMDGVRPAIPDGVPAAYRDVMEGCWMHGACGMCGGWCDGCRLPGAVAGRASGGGTAAHRCQHRHTGQ